MYRRYLHAPAPFSLFGYLFFCALIWPRFVTALLLLWQPSAARCRFFFQRRIFHPILCAFCCCRWLLCCRCIGNSWRWLGRTDSNQPETCITERTNTEGQLCAMLWLLRNGCACYYHGVKKWDGWNFRLDVSSQSGNFHFWREATHFFLPPFIRCSEFQTCVIGMVPLSWDVCQPRFVPLLLAIG